MVVVIFLVKYFTAFASCLYHVVTVVFRFGTAIPVEAIKPSWRSVFLCLIGKITDHYDRFNVRSTDNPKNPSSADK